MRKKYQSPGITMLTISEQRVMMTSNFTETEIDGIPIHTDDPQAPGKALSRQFDICTWDEEDVDEW